MSRILFPSDHRGKHSPLSVFRRSGGLFGYGGGYCEPLTAKPLRRGKGARGAVGSEGHLRTHAAEGNGLMLAGASCCAISPRDSQ